MSNSDYYALCHLAALWEWLGTVFRTKREIRALHPVLATQVFYDDMLNMWAVAAKQRPERRKEWFDRVMQSQDGCDLVFGDPDNGIVDDADWRKTGYKFGKQIPMSDVRNQSLGGGALCRDQSSQHKATRWS